MFFCSLFVSIDLFLMYIESEVMMKQSEVDLGKLGPAELKMFQPRVAVR
jgi:hypothetical protein